MTLWVAPIAQSVKSRPFIKFQVKFHVALLLNFEEISMSPFIYLLFIIINFFFF